MEPAPLLLIALALAMDAFAVALSTGAYLVKADARQTFRLSFHFGLFQFLMPILGWLAGRQVERYLSSVDHWIACALLVFIGGRMIHAAFTSTPESVRSDVTRGGSLVALSLATSIDALAVGLSLGVISSGIVIPSIVIGIVAGLMTILGLRLGERFSAMFGRKMELVGGLVLVGIGIKIVIDHLAA